MNRSAHRAGAQQLHVGGTARSGELRRLGAERGRRTALLLRCLAPDGAPVGGMQVQVRTPQGNIRAVTPATDAAGRTRADVDPGSYLLFVLPRNLQDPAALQAWLAARPGKQLADALLALGSFEVTAGPGLERDLRLPAVWEQ